MYECFDTHGDKIPRVGVASVKRILNDPVNMTDGGDECWATVSCPDARMFLNRYYADYEISYCVDEDGTPGETEFDTQREAIGKFLELRKGLMETCSE